jgi:hypothetical protein
MTGIDHEIWLQNLLIKTNFDEEKAMDLFFVYFEQFMDETKPLASEKSEGID